MRTLIYTDLLSDDLCAIEYISKYFDEAVIIAVNTDELPESPYGLKSCNTYAKFYNIAGNLFNKVQVYRAEDKYEITDFPDAIFILAKMTAPARDFEKYTELKCMDLCVMGGSENPEMQEYNQYGDLEAWNKFFDMIRDFKAARRVYSYECCEGAAKFGIPKYNGRFIDEFNAKQDKQDGEEICFDLVAVAKFIDVMNYTPIVLRDLDKGQKGKDTSVVSISSAFN